MPIIWFWLAGSFLLGAVPFGAWIGRARGVDVQASGSGNIGATNVARTLGWQAGALVLVLDTAKAALPTGVLLWLTDSPTLAAGAALVAMLGHVFSPFVGFHGGKGVACALGGLIVLNPLAASLSLLVFGLIAGGVRLVSLASLAAAGSAPLILLLLAAPPAVTLYALAVALILGLTHRANIRRLLQGTEPRFGLTKGTNP